VRWLAQLKRTRLNMVCANVWNKATKKPLVQPYVLVKKGTVTIGVLGLTSDKVDPGRRVTR
jgi:2',3'-cyclic-nucleotide 2'-phosphodiesterase (5'-nucleotidase family)